MFIEQQEGELEVGAEEVEIEVGINVAHSCPCTIATIFYHYTTNLRVLI